MAEPDLKITPAERQVLEHPATLKAFLYVLVPTIACFNVYVIISGRLFASAVLSLQLIGFIILLGVMKSRIGDHKKVIWYRYLLRIQIVIFGVYLLWVVGVRHQLEVSPWSFLFIFLLSLWMPNRMGLGMAMVFNLGLVLSFIGPHRDIFLAHKEFIVRFYFALTIFSLLAVSTAMARKKYLSNFFKARSKLKESEAKYRSLSKVLADEIKERDRIEKQLHNAIKMETVGRVAAGVAHDLNNILSGIVTYPELLLLDLKEDHPMYAPLETIKTSGVKAAAIVDDLLTLSRRGVALSQPLDLRQITEEYIHSPEYRQLMENYPEARVITRYDKGVKNMLGFPVHMSKSLMNLVINGVEAISGKGEVFIHIHPLYLESPELLEVPVQGESEIPPGEYVVVSVSDTGAGIAPEERERIFEPFYTKKKMGRSGTGLGMALVLGTVNDHQGYIRIRSTPGKGTMISLFFPVTGQDAGPEVKDAGIEALKGGQERILVVDDDPVQLNIAEKLLKRLGYRVHCRDSGEEGLRFLQQNRVDLVILDIIMEPGMSGVEACERILEIHPGQKILFVTGFSDAGTLDRARRLSKSPSLFKPYSLENMGRLVKEKCHRDDGVAQSPLS